MTVPAEILDATMRLPEQVRRELGRQLLESADPLADGSPAEVVEAWNLEASRRIREYRDGEVALLTEDDVRNMLGQ